MPTNTHFWIKVDWLWSLNQHKLLKNKAKHIFQIMMMAQKVILSGNRIVLPECDTINLLRSYFKGHLIQDENQRVGWQEG